MSKKSLNQSGFTLLEMMIACALAAGTSLIGIEIMNMMNTNSKRAERQQVQFEFHAHALKVLGENLKGVKSHQVGYVGFYKKGDQDETFIVYKSDPQIPVTNVTPLEETKYSSFFFPRKLKKLPNQPPNEPDRYINYISVCEPRPNFSVPPPNMGTDEERYKNLIKSPLWPFVRIVDKGWKAYCCPRSNPQCTTNPLFSKDSDYIAQIYKYDTKNKSLTPTLKKSEFSALSGAAFFVFASSGPDPKTLNIRLFSFYNECLSKNIFFGENRNTKCYDANSIKVSPLVEEFNYAIEGVNHLGNKLGH